MMFSFVIPGRLSGLNELIGATNRHRHVGAKLKKDETMRCANWIVANKVPTFKEPVAINFEWIEPNARRDFDNVTAGQKFIIDALVVTGCLQNDGRKWVKRLSHLFALPDKLNPRVIVGIQTI